jgi:NADH-quinone oxidoreductase subunit N
MNAMDNMNWSVILPEIVLLTMACVVAMVDLFVDDPRRRPTYWLTQATFVVVAGLHLWLIDGTLPYGMQDMVVSDAMGHLLAFSSRWPTRSPTSHRATC